jgi:hypothetical protein
MSLLLVKQLKNDQRPKGDKELYCVASEARVKLRGDCEKHLREPGNWRKKVRLTPGHCGDRSCISGL